MNIQIDAQLLMDNQKTGISWTAQKLIEGLVKTNPVNKYILNYFALFKRSQKRAFIRNLVKLGCEPSECGWFDATAYKLLYNAIPIPYKMFFGSADITHFMNYHVPPGVYGSVVTMVYDMVYKAFPETMNARTRSMLNLNMARSCIRADAIVTISQFSKEQIIKYLNLPPEKIMVMPCGVDLDLYNPNYSKDIISAVKTKHGIVGDYLLYLGTLEPRKNIERLIDAVFILKQRIKDIPKLVIAGRKGWQYNSIFEKVNRLNLNDDIIFTGYVDPEDSPPLIKGATAFVFPSIYEGFGLPPLEAMACGTPVITSNVASLPEVVGDAALLIDPYSPESIESALEKVLLSKELQTQLSLSGLKRATLFTWDNSVKILLDLYNKL